VTRVVSWFSCGAASFAATKLALRECWEGTLPYGATEVVIAYCDVLKREHPDNARFLRDAEKSFRQKIVVLGNDDYGRDPDEVFRKTRFLVGPGGARCTAELKKSVRWGFQRPDDVVVIGFTKDELATRGARLSKSEPLTRFWFPLAEKTKADCYDMVRAAGIETPAMYKLGYGNNNCIGCVKCQAGYWNKIRVDFPERFAEMAKIERELGRTVCKREWKEGGKRRLERIYLDEMAPDLGRYDSEPEMDCGILCETAK
jgi:3'-phosphoadenosine 5'-phosphosulfate sulfotransferase (PAPS reductase)/FAD synthetase